MEPRIQAYVDAGFVVAMINFRGSTGYGAEWRDALIGDIGGPELEQLNAGLEWLVIALLSTAAWVYDPSHSFPIVSTIACLLFLIVVPPRGVGRRR